jgi:hypothetical protein
VELDPAEGAAVAVGGEDPVTELAVPRPLLGSGERSGGWRGEVEPDRVRDVRLERRREVLIEDDAGEAADEGRVGFEGLPDALAGRPR